LRFSGDVNRPGASAVGAVFFVGGNKEI
jgi:hypothetical protein